MSAARVRHTALVALVVLALFFAALASLIAVAAGIFLVAAVLNDTWLNLGLAAGCSVLSAVVWVGAAFTGAEAGQLRNHLLEESWEELSA